MCPNFPSPKISGYIDGIFRQKYARILRSRGHEVFVVTTKIEGMPPFEEVGGIKVFRVPSRVIKKIRYPIPAFTELIRTILNVVEKYKVDVIEFNNHMFLTSLPIFIIRRIVKTPITLSIDGLNGITYFSGSKFVDLVGLFYTMTLGAQMFRKADGIRLSHTALIKYLRRMGVSQSRLYVVYNAVDLAVFHPNYDALAQRKDLGIGLKDTVVLYVGRLDAVKGVGYLISAAKNLMKKYGSLKLLLVGDGALYQEYREMAKGFESQIIFTGVRRDIPPLMNIADILVLPSLAEGCPNIVLEAAATATPVVATSVGASPEIIIDGKTGFLVHPRGAKELERMLQLLIENPETRRAMGESALEVVRKKFNMSAIGDHIDMFYQDVVKSKYS